MPKRKEPTPNHASEENRPVPRVSLSVDEAAEATGLSKSTLYNLMDAGTLRFVKVGARRLIPVAELNSLVSCPPQGQESSK